MRGILEKKNLLFIAAIITILAIYFFSRSNNSGIKIKGVISTLKFEKIDLASVKRPPRRLTDIEPNIYAKSSILLDVDTAAVMYSHSSDLPVAIASTTKIMTAVVALENYDLDDIVTVPKEAAQINGSDIQLITGEELTVRDLLYGLLVQSGNDAAIALAMHGQSLEDFVSLMNHKAKELGLGSTNFKDPAGLNDEGRSTAFDLATLTGYVLRKEEFRRIVNTPKKDIVSKNKNILHSLKNSNRLIVPEEPLYMGEAIGIKTGFTPEAGHCLVSAASKDGHTIISVVLNTAEQTNDASAKESRKLLKWGLINFSWD